MPKVSAGTLRPLERVMIFIDGGHLRKIVSKLCGDDSIDYGKLLNELLKMYDTLPISPFKADLIRAYYYDAIVNEKDEEFRKQNEYFESLIRMRTQRCTVRLGHLVRSARKRLKQKGVDILVAIDALTMAYQNHYNTGVFFLGDADFVPLIEAIKDAGKKTIGVFYAPNSSVELMKACDMRIYLNEQDLKEFHLRKSGAAKSK